MSKIIKFRNTGREGAIIEEMRERFGLANDSASIRLLIRQGESKINEFFKVLRDVTQPLKYSEIDYFTSSINVWLKQEKRKQAQQKEEKVV